MPRYHFNIRNGDSIRRDEEGTILPDLAQAERVAETNVRERLQRDGVSLDGQSLEITNQDGTVLNRVSLKTLFWIGAN